MRLTGCGHPFRREDCDAIRKLWQAHGGTDASSMIAYDEVDGITDRSRVLFFGVLMVELDDECPTCDLQRLKDWLAEQDIIRDTAEVPD